MTKKQICYVLLIMISGVIVIPLILEHMIFRNSIYSPGSNDGWASFFRSFFGAIIGFIGVAVTLYFSKTENDRTMEKTREENNRIIETTRIENNRVIEATKQENNRMLRSQIRPYYIYISAKSRLY